MGGEDNQRTGVAVSEAALWPRPAVGYVGVRTRQDSPWIPVTRMRPTEPAGPVSSPASAPEPRRAPSGVSLVVATVDRVEPLDRLLASVADQTGPSPEVIVVDQNPDDRLAATLARRRELGIVHVRSPRGLSAARNAGLARVTRAIVGFPDDDCWYPEGLLASVVEWFERHPDAGFVAGSYGLPGRGAGRMPRRPRAITPFSAPPRVASVSLFFRTAALETAGLQFDPRLGAGAALPAGEEIDLVLRALTAGVAGRYEPALKVYHPVERPSTRDAARVAARHRALARVLVRHGLDGHPTLLARAAGKLAKAAALAPFRPALRQAPGAILDGIRDGLRG